jgi:hypothetical protein
LSFDKLSWPSFISLTLTRRCSSGFGNEHVKRARRTRRGSILEQAAAEKPSAEVSETLRMPPSDRSFRGIDPVDVPGISASELLIRDRRW